MIYLDCHATTPCDPRVVEAMMPWWTEHFGNPHSDSHATGRRSADAMNAAIESMAGRLGVSADSFVVTSGATESINLGLRGVLMHPRCRHRRLVTCQTEHPAVLEVAHDLRSIGVDVEVVGVHGHDSPTPGQVDLDQLRDALQTPTGLVSVMIANNEMGAIAPMANIAKMTHDAGALLHCDATQAIGRMTVDVRGWDVDLMTASAHKFYGPKGVGWLIAGNGNRRVRLRPQMVGGGQQRGIRGGTMSPPAVIGMAKALELALADQATVMDRVDHFRNQLWSRLSAAIDDCRINGPSLSAGHRLPGNLNFRLQKIEGETWMAAAPDVAFSSGSACSSADALPSHVLLAMGLSESEARRSVRFGIGHMTTQADIDTAADQLIAAHGRLLGRG